MQKKILESEDFYDYLETRAINASGKSIRISVNDVKNYPIIVWGMNNGGKSERNKF